MNRVLLIFVLVGVAECSSYTPDAGDQVVLVEKPCDCNRSDIHGGRGSWKAFLRLASISRFTSSISQEAQSQTSVATQWRPR